MTPDDPRHGTYTGYNNHGCRCFQCRLAYHKTLTERRQRTGPSSVPAEPARNHINQWRTTTGQGRWRFARLAGVNESTITNILAGTPSIYARTSAAILAVPLDAKSDGRRGEVEVWPLRRRAQALSALGWSLKAQSALLGMSPGWVTAVLAQDWANEATAVAIRDLYDRIHMTLPPTDTVEQRISATRTRNDALKRGWPPPLAWVDIDNDPKPTGLAGYRDPKPADHIDHAVIEQLLAGTTVPSNNAEKTEAMRAWMAMGNTGRSLSLAHGWKPGRYMNGKDAA